MLNVESARQNLHSFVLYIPLFLGTGGEQVVCRLRSHFPDNLNLPRTFVNLRTLRFFVYRQSLSHASGFFFQIVLPKPTLWNYLNTIRLRLNNHETRREKLEVISGEREKACPFLL